MFVAIAGMFILPLKLMKSSAAEDYHSWRQTDSRWGNITLGSSNQTMAKSGCLVTSIAIMAVYSGAKSADNFNPGVLANSLNSVNAFSNGAISSWGKITEVIPDIKFIKKYSFTSSTQSGKASEMKSLTDQGYYYTCNVGNHWVFIERIEGSDVYMVDPAKDSVKLFEAYPLSSISELRVFTSKNPPQKVTSVKATEAKPIPTVPPATAAPVIEKWKLGEYYSACDSIGIFASPDTNSAMIETLESGYIVKITEVKGDMGCIQLGAERGWIDMNKLSAAGNSVNQATGDINNDGNIDKLDLSLLNEYITSLSELPDGISLLRECEVNAADINSDGVVDNNDVLEYLAIICE